MSKAEMTGKISFAWKSLNGWV